MRPLVSVVIPTYNKSHLLAGRSVPSVLAQTYPNIECVIVDDGSQDDTWETMQRLAEQDSRIRIFRLPENHGASAATNFSIRQARGEFIAYLDHDDEYAPRFAEETLARILTLSPEYGAVGCAATIIFEDGKRVLGIPPVEQSFYVAMSDGWLFRRAVFFEQGLFFDEELSSDADTDFGIRFFEKYKAAVIPRPLLVKYVRSNIFDQHGLSAITPRRLKDQRRFLEKNLGKFEAARNRRELAFILRQAGRNFVLGGSRREGLPLLWRAVRVRPSLRNIAHLFLAWCGQGVYLSFFHLERFLFR